MSSDILEKVRVFLESANKDSVEVSDELIDQFGDACKESFRKQFTDQRKKEFGPQTAESNAQSSMRRPSVKP